MNKRLKYYIKKRRNPQLGTYYSAYGQITKKKAKEIEDKCLYGSNLMLSYDTEEEYKKALKEYNIHDTNATM